MTEKVYPKRIEFLKKVVESSSLEQKLYIAGLLLFLNYGLAWMVGYENSVILLFIACLVASSGFVVRSITFLEKLWDNSFGKALLSLVLALGTTLAVAVSTSLISDIVGSDPSKFALSITATGILITPFMVALGLYIWATIVAIVLTLFLGLFFIIDQVKQSDEFRYIFGIKDKEKPAFLWATRVARFVAIGLIVGSAQFALNNERAYLEWTKVKVTSFVYYFEMYPKTHCDREALSERFAYLNAKEVIVGDYRQGEFSFSTRPCYSKENHTAEN